MDFREEGIFMDRFDVSVQNLVDGSNRGNLLRVYKRVADHSYENNLKSIEKFELCKIA